MLRALLYVGGRAISEMMKDLYVGWGSGGKIAAKPLAVWGRSAERGRPGQKGATSAGGYVRAGDLNHATGTGGYRQAESVQFHDRRDQAEAEPDALGLPAPVRTIEASGHDLALVVGDARARIAHAHDAFAGAVDQRNPDVSAFRRELHRVVDNIGDRLEQQVAVAMHHRFVVGLYLENDALFLGDRLVEIADLPHQHRQCDVAEPGEPPIVLDLRDAQYRRYNGKRLIETANGVVENGV